MEYFSSLQSKKNPLGWLLDISYPKESKVSISLGAGPLSLGGTKYLIKQIEVLDSASKGGPPNLLCLRQKQTKYLEW